jgi:hypothetical protein
VAPAFVPAFFKPDQPMSAYAGNDIDKTWAWIQAQLDAIPNKPDQFSTSAERQAYADAVNAKVAGFGQLVLPANCQTKYDADAAQWNIKRPIFKVDEFDLPTERRSTTVRQVILGLKNVQRDTYAAQNAYGATINVSRTRADQYVVQFTYDWQNAPVSAARVSSGGGTRYEVVSVESAIPMEPAKCRGPI